MNAKTSLKCKSGEIITGHINPEIVFRRALVLANSRLHFSCEVLLVHVIPALSFIALLSDAMKCLVSVHLTRADF
jgi:hypothetical protein